MPELLTRYKRYAQITAVFAKHDIGYLIDLLGLGKLFSGNDKPTETTALTKAETTALAKKIDEVDKLSIPERLRMAFEELGPTFVKMGQIVSTRPDLIPRPYIDEFRKLQDHVAPITFDQIKEVVEAELGKTIEEAFSSFEEEPLAAASIGQVHRCVLKDGTLAVAKVQRPHIEEQIRMDLTILYSIARLANHSAIAEAIDMVHIIREFERVILRELDFTSEGRLTEEFAHTYQDDPQVHIAEIFWDYSSRRLLTMEYLDGINVSDIQKLHQQGVDTQAIAKKISMLTLQQIFIDGLFHADPHPGNLMVLPGGVLGIIDFGMTGRFDRYTLAMLRDLMLDILSQDHIALASHLLDHDVINYDVDMRKLRQDTRGLFRNLASLPMAQASEALQKFIVEHKLRFPPDLFFLDKTFGTLDGTIRLLSPNFDMNSIAQEFGAEFGFRATDLESLSKTLAMRILRDADAIVEMPILLRRLLRRMDAGYLNFSNTLQLSDSSYAQINKLGLRALLSLCGFFGISTSFFLKHTQTKNTLLYGGIAFVALALLGLWRDSRG